MSKEDLVFPGEPVVRVKDPSALEFPEMPRAQTGGVKHDLRFPEGEEAQEAKIVEGSEASESKSTQAAQVDTKAKEARKPCALTLTHSETETLEDPLEASEEHQKSGSSLCASPRPGRVFACRALTAVAAVALVGLGVVAVRPLDGRKRPVLAVPALAVGAVVVGVVACGARFAR